MVDINNQNNSKIDFSFIVTLNCNLNCSFCMYDSGEHQKDVLDVNKTKQFINTIDFDKINSIGFYGGEISKNMESFQKIINLIPKDVQKFCITNGTWINRINDTEKFLTFSCSNRLKVFVSTTDEHRNFRDNNLLYKLVLMNDFIEFKKDDTEDKLLPMGRNYTKKWNCSDKCENINKPLRYAILPNGNIIFQNCDGVYPIVGDYNESFNSIINREINCKMKKEEN